MQAVFKHIACHGIAEAIEEVHADTDECQVYPGLVVEEVCKGLERELLSTDGLQPFLGKQSAGQRSHSSDDAEEGAYHGILVLFGTSHHFL